MRETGVKDLLLASLLVFSSVFLVEGSLARLPDVVWTCRRSPPSSSTPRAGKHAELSILNTGVIHEDA